MLDLTLFLARRRLAPHQLVPMSGARKAFQRTKSLARLFR